MLDHGRRAMGEEDGFDFDVFIKVGIFSRTGSYGKSGEQAW
jgi:hypothetical protein